VLWRTAHFGVRAPGVVGPPAIAVARHEIYFSEASP
jgi:hypothetical protein